jgi:hypothetical protein
VERENSTHCDVIMSVGEQHVLAIASVEACIGFWYARLRTALRLSGLIAFISKREFSKPRATIY